MLISIVRFIIVLVVLQELVNAAVIIEQRGSVASSAHEEHKDYDIAKPVYELQLAVWPTEVDDVFDAVQEVSPMEPIVEEQQVLYPEEQTDFEHQTSDEPVQIPVYEDQLVIFPDDIDSEEIHFEDAAEDELDKLDSTQKPLEAVTSGQSIHVVESYRMTHPNGTSEYKLVLSNGLVNYKKIYNKILNGVVIPVQEGYDSIPIPGQTNQFQTQYYVSDERGHNVYRAEHNSRRPEFPTFLDYKHEMNLQ